MKLNEILNKKVDYEVIYDGNDSFETSAKIGNRLIKFYASKEGDSDEDTGAILGNNWSIFFLERSEKTYSSQNKTGSGNEFEVFSFVKECILKVISKHKPDEITFSAEKDDKGKTNRASMYERLLKRFIGTVPNYSLGQIAKLGVGDNGPKDRTLFTITKNK